jgi:sodium/bile acid cotransporter 7
MSVGALLRKQWFLCCVAMGIGVAWLEPEIGIKGGPLKPEVFVSQFAIMVIFFCSGITLETAKIQSTLVRYRLHAVVQLFSMVAIPLLLWLGLSLLEMLYDPSRVYGEALSENEEDSAAPVLASVLTGFRLLSFIPPPVSTGFILTQAVGGNQAAALCNSTFGSFIGVFITPMLWYYFVGSHQGLMEAHGLVATGDGGAAAGGPDAMKLVMSLVQVVLLPLLAGQMSRKALISTLKQPTFGHSSSSSSSSSSVGSRELAARVLAFPYSVVGKLVLVLIIYTLFCDTFHSDIQVEASQVIGVALGVVLTQVAALTSLFWLANRCSFLSKEDVVAVLFTGTHKSLTLGIMLLKLVYQEHPHFMLLSLPLIVYHPTQILLGSLLVAPLKRWMTSNHALSASRQTSMGNRTDSLP